MILLNPNLKNNSMIHQSVSEINFAQTFIQLKNIIDHPFYLKIEGLNLAGSIKLKTAHFILNGFENRFGKEIHKYKFIESSSGNLGIALSMLCQERGYDFTCVVDVNTERDSIKMIELYGGRVIEITTEDEYGGYLKSRINYIKQFIKNNPEYIWTNQYANQDSLNAHYQTTAQELYNEFSNTINYLFIGAGTTGTLGGCAKFFQQHSPNTKIIAVEPNGSITFGSAAKKRFFPGIGTSCKPEIASLFNVDEVVYITEQETVYSCYELAQKQGFLAGASSGSVLSAIKKHEHNFSASDIVVGIAPDLGGKYLQTLYNKEWLEKHHFSNVIQEE
jgi:cysteine synthase A